MMTKEEKERLAELERDVRTLRTDVARLAQELASYRQQRVVIVPTVVPHYPHPSSPSPYSPFKNKLRGGARRV